MKSKIVQALGGLVVIAMFAWHTGYSQTVFVIKSVKASIHGTSTLHDWKSEITKITFTGHFQTSASTWKEIKNISVKIPVEGIKSDEGKIMNEKTYEAFKATENPFITFTADNALFKADSAESAVIHVTGNLTMAGTTKPTEVQANGRLLPNGDIQISVSKKLAMTSFNMKPPSAVLGTIKVGDEVIVNVDLMLTPGDDVKITSKN
jgi:polyisoprenoid-binding protein YceI